MTLLAFKSAELEPILRHALAAPKHRPSWGQPEPIAPALWLVGDRGVYLMSNGDPIDFIGPKQVRVAFAKGCDPKVDEHWYDRKYQINTDDFVEVLPWCEDMLDAIASGRQTIAIEVTRKQIRFA